MADTDITRELDELRKQARSAKRILEPDWFLNLAYFQGSQWLAWNGRNLHKPQLSAGRMTVTENRVQAVIRTELAKMTKNQPAFTVTPRTADEQDSNAAELAEQVMRYLWKHLKLQHLTYKGLEWSRICGAGFLKCYWDSTVGPKQTVIVDTSGKLFTGPDGKVVKANTPEALVALQMGEGKLKPKQVAQGDIKAEVRSPFQMFVDPLADTFEDAEWVIEESIKSKEYVSRRYDVELKPDTAANPGMIEARLLGAMNSEGSSTYKGIKVREYWCKPCKDHPRGCRIVWAQEKVLAKDEQPFDPQPYVMFSGITIPGRLWPLSTIDFLRNPQTELNKVRSQMAENRNRIGNPTLLASKQAVQDAEKFLDSTTLPGGVYFYDDIGSPNALPRYLEAPSLPEYVAEEPQMIRQAIEDISGQHEVTNAQVPPGVTAASAITLLQEADDTRLGPSTTDYETELGRFGQKLLNLVAEYYTDARTIKIGGENGAWQIFDFRGEMMNGNTHVEVQAGSAFPQSKAAKQAMIQDWMTFFVQSGNPPHGRQLAQFMQDSGMGATDRLVEQYTIDEQQVNRENILLALGNRLPINPYDNDQAHIDGHTEFEKSVRFQQLAPEGQQIHLAHTDAHRQRLAQQQQQQMLLQMQQQGIPTPQEQQAQQAQQGAQQAQQAHMEAAQAQQDMQLKAAQQQQQMAGQGAQANQSYAQSEAQRVQQLRHQQESHQQQMAHQQQLHEAKLEQMRAQAHAQAQAARQRGANSG